MFKYYRWIIKTKQYIIMCNKNILRFLEEISNRISLKYKKSYVSSLFNTMEFKEQQNNNKIIFEIRICCMYLIVTRPMWSIHKEFNCFLHLILLFFCVCRCANWRNKISMCWFHPQQQSHFDISTLCSGKSRKLQTVSGRILKKYSKLPNSI